MSTKFFRNGRWMTLAEAQKQKEPVEVLEKATELGAEEVKAEAKPKSKKKK